LLFVFGGGSLLLRLNANVEYLPLIEGVLLFLVRGSSVLARSQQWPGVPGSSASWRSLAPGLSWCRAAT
jgi:hypothetical protein